MCPSTANVEKKDLSFNLQEKITEVEEKITEVETAKSQNKENPKIQRVPKHLRERDVELQQYSMAADETAAAAVAPTTLHGGGATFHHDLHDLPKLQSKVATRYYTPKMISMGPIHHHLKLGEEYKLQWTAKYVKEMEKNINTQQLYQKIRDNIGELKKLFAEEVIDGYGNDDYLSWMLFVDGCSLLYFMEHYGKEHPETNLGIKHDQLIYMSRDLILLENQLPYRVLELLSIAGQSKANGLLDIMGTYANAIIKKRKYFNPNTSKQEEGQTQSTPGPHSAVTVHLPEPPIHLLHFVRTKFLDNIGRGKNKGKENKQSQSEQEEGQCWLPDFVQKYILWRPQTKAEPTYKNKGKENEQSQSEQEEGQSWLPDFVQKYILWRPQTKAEPTYKNIRDLKAANIGVKRAKEGSRISYESRFGVLGYLLIPKFRVDDTTAVIILNVIAFEMCPDFWNDYEVSLFVGFLESIIDDAEDVRVLRKAGIIDNVLGSDEEVAQLFNSLSSDLVVIDKEYLGVKKQIEFHYSHRVRTWIAEFLYNHFSSPWTLAAFSAAVIALVLSGIQTYLTVFPVDNK